MAPTSSIRGTSTGAPPKKSLPVCARSASPKATSSLSTPKPVSSSTWPISASSPTAPSPPPCTQTIRPRTWCAPSNPPARAPSSSKTPRRPSPSTPPPMSPTYPAPDLVRPIQPAGARAVFVEAPKTLQPLRGAPAAHWILLTGEAEGAISLDALRQLGQDALAGDAELLARIRSGLSPSDTAILYLTSGATGEPKMALVTHQSVVANIDMGPEALPLGPRDSTVAFLPSAHIAQRVVMEFLPMRCGMPVTFFESLLKLPQDIRKVRPTILLAPPRMWERIYSTICTELRKRPAAIRQGFYGALG